MQIRLADNSELSQILDIYAPYIRDTSITFENEIPSLTDFQERFQRISSRFPWLVCEEEGEILGYAYAAPYRDRIAYQWSVESSVYLKKSAQRRGIASRLYAALFKILKLQGLINVYAIITVPNEQSIGFHLSQGFADVGTFYKVGYKLQKWHDVHWMILKLGNYENEPLKPVYFDIVQNDSAVGDILRSS